MRISIIVITGAILAGVSNEYAATQTSPPAIRFDPEPLFEQLGDLPAVRSLQAARELAIAGRYDDATSAYVTLWRRDGRVLAGADFLVDMHFFGDIQELVRVHPAAAEAFSKLRDEAQSKHATESWIRFNRALDDEARTLVWFDAAKANPESARDIESAAFLLQELLIRRGRWADVATLYRDPLGRHALEAAALDAAAVPDGPFGVPEDVLEYRRKGFRDFSAQMYAAMLAAGRVNDAEKVATKARVHDPSGRMVVTLVRTALIADEPRAEHLEWLHEASQMGEATDGLFPQVEEALRQRM